MNWQGFTLVAIAALTSPVAQDHGRAAAARAGLGQAAERESAPDLTALPPLSPSEIVERAGPAVVMINATAGDRIRQGSGFLADPTGAIVTSLHVLDGAERVRVALPDGRQFDEVTVLAFDVENDLVVVKVEAPSEGPLPVAALGQASLMEVGDSILVISNPLGLDLTVTEGILSARRDTDSGPDDANVSARHLFTGRLLQISAAISPGSSGGPVLNDRAEVIGIATAGILHGMASLNFAVPVDEVYRLLDQDLAIDLRTFGRRLERARQEAADPYFDRAQIAFEREDLQVTGQLLGKALRLFPTHEKALLLSGRIAREGGELQRAETLFRTAVEAHPESADAWYWLGSVHELMASETNSAPLLDRAQSAYERSLELDDRQALAALRLAVIHMRQQHLARAEELLNLAIDSQPELADAHYLLGEIHLGRGLYRDAEASFEQALWEDGDHALSHFGLAHVYMLSGGKVRGNASRHWEEFLRLSKGVESLQRERNLALRIVEMEYPELLDR